MFGVVYSSMCASKRSLSGIIRMRFSTIEQISIKTITGTQ